ncbi:hypothetical protein DSM106972_090640 [Dulcicalothrix desertica PCC 7102]|uniref:Phenolphthiocerol/phthiocerol polyketide synthase subunit E n=1 Tax=Dulcicalothrix desertica PCC 7102 TaxID=232991 RepID=A0A433UN78_9CYAN|nr:type I polyketide synthase [Dulcicalothrix desertica]RUS95288.1 hypothetical protein DSM106972_090640 [Dulcicalothrix desertica PCC 7102]TWH43976.1 acyl transferase domain-containing protein [Dulcicalothrix desertica PCC 7102]
MNKPSLPLTNDLNNDFLNPSEIAIIGMTGRFPGAKDIDEFWRNLQHGVESISFFSDEELNSSGVNPAVLNNSNYVKANAILPDIDLFDASFFGFRAREAEMTDPQHRIFLECAWNAIESAGYNTETYNGAIGIYAGVGMNTYLLNNLLSNLDLSEPTAIYQATITNDKDFLSTRVSYKLNLTGPSITIQTACSTSLVAVHLACQSLLNGECDIALAGGISINIPQEIGYLYQEGMILSPDGHCRAFDANAQGTVNGSGVGIVVLKRLADAITDGDCIHAIIKGSAINNDGSVKVGYTAPSVDGQKAVISEAQAIAGVEAETITYVETHGTGTVLGDPIEIAALTKAFRVTTEKKGFCAIGSVKTNIGHLDAAAGVTGLIKTVLALKHKMIPPSLHFEKPNPKIDFANSPFYVNTTLSEWKTDKTPRRAGVSSFGIGGTNSHVVIEEACFDKPSGKSRPWQLLLLSAKTSSALEDATKNLVEHLQKHPDQKHTDQKHTDQKHPDLNLADVAYTLNIGRSAFSHRRLVICENFDDAVTALKTLDSKRVLNNFQDSKERPVIFMFSGQGAQYVNMGRSLYESEPIFKEQVDKCCELLKLHIGLDLRTVLYPEQKVDEATQLLQQTAIAQPALFVIEYALAQLWMAWGVHPEAMIGHSIGEYVAATLAGVFSLEDALIIVANRGKLMQQCKSGAMLSVQLSEQEVKPLLAPELSLAASNGPSYCVVSGTTEAVEQLQQHLEQKNVICRRLHVSHAFHSQMMEPIIEPFTQLLNVALNPPKIPFVSNVSGTWITAAEATDPNYWAKHLRQTVRFNEGIVEILKEPERILLEVGPGRTLSSFALQHQTQELVALTSLRHPQEQHSDVAFILNTLGRLWLFGVKIDWSGFYAYEQRHRIPLPTYPFERQRYWIEPQQQVQRTSDSKHSFCSPNSILSKLVKAAQSQARAEIKGFDEQTYLANQHCLDRLCAAYINLYLNHSGVFSNPNKNYSIEQLFEKCQIIPRYRQLLCRWLNILVEQSQLHKDQDLFTNFVPFSDDSLNALLKEVRSKFADTPEVVDIVQHCGENLESVLTGEKEPLELYAGSTQNTENLNQKLPLYEYYKDIIKTSLEQVVKLLPPDVNLRILEIGGGQGIATEALLPILPPQTNYTFTDVGSLFLRLAQQKFGAYPFVEYRLLDIEQPPTEQGYSTHSFDVVIAVNVLHVTRNMTQTLEHVRSLLAPGGLLLLWEITQPEVSFDITDGLLMNPITDEERSQGNPFLSKEQWHKALRDSGFVEVVTLSETEAFGHDVLVAQASTLTNLSTPSAFTVLVPKNADQIPQSLEQKPDIADWFYVPSWKRTMAPQRFDVKVQTKPGCWLVFTDEYGLGEEITQQLASLGQDIITVKVGEQFSQDSEFPQRVYRINPQHQDDYNKLFKELRTLNLIPKTIVHLWSVTPNLEELSIDSLENSQYESFYSLLFLTQALSENNQTHSLEIAIVSNNMQEVTSSELMCPEKAFVLGACKVIEQEYRNILCRSIDIDVIPKTENWQNKKLVNQLLAELKSELSDRVVAYRGLHRWVQTFEPVRLNETVEETPQLREGGVYLITGGLGGVGLFNAEYLAKTVHAKLILIGRSVFPERDEWLQWLSSHEPDDSISCKIRKIQALEALGAEILVLNADVTEREQMEAAITQAKNRFGQIHGVIHNAAEDKQELIAQTTLSTRGIVFSPKILGTLVLNQIFQDVDLDFLILTSSQASILGGIGQAEYTATCAFLDAFAHYSASKHSRLIKSINWNRWKTPEWIAKANLERVSQGLTLEQSGLTLEEGMEALKRILYSSTVPQIVVSNSDFNELINRNLINLHSTLNSLEEEFSKASQAKSTHKRPNLANAYVPPSNEIENTLADIWQETFGIEQVGIYDNFFELGGDSLLATVVLSRLRKSFEIELPYKSFFDEPTIAKIAEILVQKMSEQAEQEELAKALADIEQLTEDEALTLIQQGIELKSSP